MCTLAFAKEVALRAGQLLREGLRGPLEITMKGAINPVTQMDRAAEELIVAAIAERFPDCAILAEEGGARVGKDTSRRWIVDPLDGTVNYAHRWPHWAVSLALEVANVVEVGVVYAPVYGELFWAERGHGAFLNGERLTVSQVPGLGAALLNTGFPYDTRQNPDNLPHFNRFTLEAQAVRRTGVATLDLAWVAAGRVDGYWEPRLFPWDMAAGWLLVEEAGGQVSRFDGSPFQLESDWPEILASNGRLHPQLTARFQTTAARK